MKDLRIPRPESASEFVEAVIQPLATALGQASAAGDSRKVLLDLTRGQKLLLGYFTYWDDVTNGGHSQYFSNYTGDLWPEAVEATEALRLPEAPILRKAVALFPNSKPERTPAVRQEQLEQIDTDKLDELDEQFSEAPGSTDQLREFIEAHADEFFVEKKA